MKAGRREPFLDAAFYDWEYRRRRVDVRFYRTLLAERGGPVLDLGCGTGRLLVPLLRDGFRVVGVDLSSAMLKRAQARLAGLPAATRARAALIRADMTQLSFKPRFAAAVIAFHGLQHVTNRRDLARTFRAVASALRPGGWLVFDLFLPAPAFLARDSTRWWDRTVFRHPETGKSTAYTLKQRHDRRRRLLLMTMRYQPLDGKGRPVGPARLTRLCHRLWKPPEIDRLLSAGGWQTLARYAAFDGRLWSAQAQEETEQLIVVARRSPQRPETRRKTARHDPPI